MMQYVLQAPNVWHGFLNQVPNSVAAMQGTAGTQANLDDGIGSMAGMRGGGSDMSTIEGAMGRGFDGAENTTGSGGKKDHEQERLSAEGHLMNEATIREMSTMTFA